MEEIKVIEDDEITGKLKESYDVLYKKIEDLVDGSNVIDMSKDPEYIKVLIGAAMTIVEEFKKDDKSKLTGEEKKKLALELVKHVISDLGKKGKLDKKVANDIIKNIDFWGGIVMDVAVDVGKQVYNVGQEFAKDVAESGCTDAIKQNCGCCIIS